MRHLLIPRLSRSKAGRRNGSSYDAISWGDRNIAGGFAVDDETRRGAPPSDGHAPTKPARPTPQSPLVDSLIDLVIDGAAAITKAAAKRAARSLTGSPARKRTAAKAGLLDAPKKASKKKKAAAKPAGADGAKTKKAKTGAARKKTAKLSKASTAKAETSKSRTPPSKASKSTASKPKAPKAGKSKTSKSKTSKSKTSKSKTIKSKKASKSKSRR
ncbi:recombinase RecQ [Rhodopseudomonas pseudopalustris]|uniref:recombinase RecQ n=1 Tax=Rhodopseudomonas pseudopalustris TaxID=1513892 RepID=UPI001113FEA6|nr:recombinase RecQ [Rhodopseudomonas pseudopalustris]